VSLNPCPSCGEYREGDECQNCRDIGPAGRPSMSDDLMPKMRERVYDVASAAQEWHDAVFADQTRTGAGLRDERNAAWSRFIEAAESLARDLQTARSDFERAELARARAESRLAAQAPVIAAAPIHRHGRKPNADHPHCPACGVVVYNAVAAETARKGGWKVPEKFEPGTGTNERSKAIQAEKARLRAAVDAMAKEES